jgi:hypothetical protein
MAKTRTWKQTRATAARRRKAAKAAHRRNRGNWSGYDGEQKHSAMKAAFKAFLMSDTQSVAKTRKSPDSTVYMPFLTALMKPRKPEIAVPDAKPFKPFQSNRRAA